MGFYCFLPFTFFWLQTPCPPVILHRTLLMFIMTSVTMQTANSTAVKKSQEHTKGILYVLPPVFYYVIEVLPNSEILIILTDHVSNKRMSYSFLYSLGQNHKKCEIKRNNLARTITLYSFIYHQHFVFHSFTNCNSQFFLYPSHW